MMTDIPGFRRRELFCIACNNGSLKILAADDIIAELRSKYCTSVAYFSTRGKSKEVETLQNSRSSLVGALYTEDLENNDCSALCDKITEMVERKFVRAIVIDCLEGLDIKDFDDGGIRAKRNEIMTHLWFTAGYENVRILLFCPWRKSHEYKNRLDSVNGILSQMSKWKNSDTISYINNKLKVKL